MRTTPALLLAALLLTACETPPPSAPQSPTSVATQPAADTADLTKTAVAMLQESLQHVHLHESTIATLAPEWSVEPPPSIQTWEAAQTYADSKLSAKPALRALGPLEIHPEKRPVSRLAALKLPDLGFRTSNSLGESVTYVLDPQFPNPPSANIPEANTRLSFFHSPQKILAPGILTLKHHTIANIPFDSLSFNVSGKLVAFTRSKSHPTGTLNIGANTGGTDGVNFYYADFIPTTGPTQPLKLPPIAKQN